MNSRKSTINIMCLLLFLILLVVFPAQLVTFRLRGFFEIGIIFISLIYVVKRIGKGFFNSVFWCLSGIIFISFINFRMGNITRSNMVQCSIQYIGLIVLYDMLLIMHKKNRDRETIDTCLFTFLFYTIVNFISVLVIGVDSQNNLLYVFGNKFRVGYYIIYLLGFIYCKYNKKITSHFFYKFLFIFGVSISIIFSYYIACSTVTVTLFLFLIMIILIKRAPSFMSNTIFMIGCIIASGFIVLGIETILNASFIQNILLALNEDFSLGGRLRVYSLYMLPLILKSKYIGYGYGNTVMLSYSKAFANAQNGMFDFILNNGIVGFSLYMIIIIICLRKSKKEPEKYGLYLILLAMILTAIIEVTFGPFMLVVLFVIRWYDPNGCAYCCK